VNDRFDHLFIAPADYGRSVAFYRDILGWAVMSSWGEAGSRGTVFSGGGIKVVVAERHEGESPRQGPAARVHLDIHDVARRFEAMPKGPHILVEPGPTHWGTFWFVVRDPDGNEYAFEELRARG
jgi:catechol 2,3-dioxygenase-like lactoylglutathione lyase family enzyme